MIAQLEIPASRSPQVLSERVVLWKGYAMDGPGSPIENNLVEQYLPLVKTVVGRLAMSLPAHVDIEDLYSAGLVGLLNAVRRFDARTGASFETYARVRIRGSVFDELRRLDWVPRSVHEKSRKVQQVMQRLEQQKGEAPTDIEMAREMKLSLDEYLELLDAIKPATFVCLDSVRGTESDDGASQYESVADERQQDPGEGTARRELARMIATAPMQEAARFTERDLILSRANKSVRLFDHVTARLRQGAQPDPALIRDSGYLMRTTAVYGNGKFGIADRDVIADRPGLRGPFMAEMLTV